MSKNIYRGLGVVALCGMLFVCGATKEAAAEVSVDINLGLPPIIVSEPPEVVMVPGSQVYFVPRLEFDVFFHNGYWWSPRGGRWYRTRDYNGQWQVIDKRYVPRAVHRVPRNYRDVYVRERPIPYGQWKKQGYRHEAKHQEIRSDRKEIRSDKQELKDDRREIRENRNNPNVSQKEKREDIKEFREDRRELKEDRQELRDDKRKR
ncbi:MAG: hypothetical protein A2511_04440 [Deltaproteobacteria bacterium RIFOXYD12_FULL_50_9]|nr:MAG: hypothetical protein A2511_04440 [Deltaproteobacteria bacterium RIFOXYD12_FULL_50_9]